eukprot:s394_g10.t1
MPRPSACPLTQLAMDHLKSGRSSLSAAMIAGSSSLGASDTQLVSEALYGMFLLSRRSGGLEIVGKDAAAQRSDDSLSTSAGSEGSDIDRYERQEFCQLSCARWCGVFKESADVPPPPGLEAKGFLPPPGLEDIEPLSLLSMETPTVTDGFSYSLMPWTASLPLSSHLLGLLSSRRGKQRLRSVEQQSGAQLMLDRCSTGRMRDEQWQMLHLAGACPSIYKAQELLEIMEGFTVDISSAMWTELMRCRREDEENGSPLTLSKVQEIVGYRVHVERDSLALRIFGPKNMESSASILLKRLEELCVKEVLKLPEDCDWNEIKMLQKSGNLTLRVEGDFVELEGIQSAVLEMKQELCKRLKVMEPQDLRQYQCVLLDIECGFERNGQFGDLKIHAQF